MLNTLSFEQRTDQVIAFTSQRNFYTLSKHTVWLKITVFPERMSIAVVKNENFIKLLCHLVIHGKTQKHFYSIFYLFLNAKVFTWILKSWAKRAWFGVISNMFWMVCWLSIFLNVLDPIKLRHMHSVAMFSFSFSANRSHQVLRGLRNFYFKHHIGELSQ